VSRDSLYVTPNHHLCHTIPHTIPALIAKGQPCHKQPFMEIKATPPQIRPCSTHTAPTPIGLAFYSACPAALGITYPITCPITYLSTPVSTPAITVAIKHPLPPLPSTLEVTLHALTWSMLTTPLLARSQRLFLTNASLTPPFSCWVNLPPKSFSPLPFYMAFFQIKSKQDTPPPPHSVNSSTHYILSPFCWIIWTSDLSNLELTSYAL